MERVVALVKGVLRRTGLLKPTELNDIRLVRETIRTLGQRVREGYTPREDGADASSQYSRSGKPDPFKVPEGEGERYRDDLARMMKSLRSTDLTVNIGRTLPDRVTLAHQICRWLSPATLCVRPPMV